MAEEIVTTATSNWFVYMVRCNDESLYTGIAIDVERRIDEHNGTGKTGSKYTRARRPVKLVYQEQHVSRSEALKREMQIKDLLKQDKEILIHDAEK